ncbi:brain acid soluble protein 1 [Diabrotica virgifera virgifera]|uniref:Brain acid soluble protein 1 n=1 Tax=Diabrotica virgifera virgifera TaxID=50390 RepID=A0A6P7GZC0_DIAVI|nr:brain acid soluble protein 1 [Diabrotica virgifera virgifera]
MTDKVEQPSVEVTEEEPKIKDDKASPVKPAEKVENGDAKANEDEEKEKSSENGAEKTEENGSSESEEKPAVKRKSTGGGDATDSVDVESATPEKKAKLDEKESAEAKADTEVEA